MPVLQYTSSKNLLGCTTFHLLSTTQSNTDSIANFSRFLRNSGNYLRSFDTILRQFRMNFKELQVFRD
jgi:hypothetical protein